MGSSSSSWRKKIARAKKRHRPSLKDWECDGLYETFPHFVQGLPDRSALIYPSSSSASSSAAAAGVDDKNNAVAIIHRYGENLPVRLDAQTLTLETFRTQYESPCIPCLIDNLPAGYDNGTFVGAWPAVQKWTLKNFAQEQDNNSMDVDDETKNNDNDDNDDMHALRNRLFKCGEDDDGSKIKVKLKHFMKYLRHNHDDSPLYIFDSSFENDKRAKKLLDDYTVPSYFTEDIFRLCSEQRRPPYRWILIGPARSGSTVHRDPLATNAWNTLLSGRKRWVLFPPHVAKSIVKGKGLIGPHEDDEASHYFMTILPRIKRRAAQIRAARQNNNGHGKINGKINGDQHKDHYKMDDDEDASNLYRDFACYEFTQYAGETVFVPHDWWHAVVNLTDTVGITQNYGSPRHFEHVWLKTRSSRKRLAWKLLCRLEQEYPALAAQARRLNGRDRFKMKYEEQERRRQMQRTV